MFESASAALAMPHLSPANLALDRLEVISKRQATPLTKKSNVKSYR
jgi:hypothetical protein